MYRIDLKEHPHTWHHVKCGELQDRMLCQLYSNVSLQTDTEDGDLKKLSLHKHDEWWKAVACRWNKQRSLDHGDIFPICLLTLSATQYKCKIRKITIVILGFWKIKKCHNKLQLEGGWKEILSLKKKRLSVIKKIKDMSSQKSKYFSS